MNNINDIFVKGKKKIIINNINNMIFIVFIFLLLSHFSLETVIMFLDMPFLVIMITCNIFIPGPSLASTFTPVIMTSKVASPPVFSNQNIGV